MIFNPLQNDRFIDFSLKFAAAFQLRIKTARTSRSAKHLCRFIDSNGIWTAAAQPRAAAAQMPFISCFPFISCPFYFTHQKPAQPILSLDYEHRRQNNRHPSYLRRGDMLRQEHGA